MKKLGLQHFKEEGHNSPQKKINAWRISLSLYLPALASHKPHCVTESSYLALCQRESCDHPWKWQCHADFSLHLLSRASSNSRVLTLYRNTRKHELSQFAITEVQTEVIPFFLRVSQTGKQPLITFS